MSQSKQWNYVRYQSTTANQDEYVFTNCTNNNKVNVLIQNIRDDGTYLLHGNEYYGLPKLLPPLVTKNKLNDWIFTFGNMVYCQPISIFQAKNKPITLLDRDIELLNNTYPQLNITSNVIMDNVLHCIDMKELYNENYTANDYRILQFRKRLKTIIDCFCYSERLDYSDIKICVNSIINGSDTRLLSGEEMENSVIKREIILPDYDMDHVYEKNYKYIIDTLSTPQSNMSGTIASLAKNAYIKDEYIYPGTSIFSEHVSSAVAFPQFIQPERVVIVHSTVKQSLKTKNQELPLIQPKIESPIPIYGVNGYILMMDYLWTSNDGIIISESFAESLYSTITSSKRFVLSNNNYEILCKIGDTIKPSDYIIQINNINSSTQYLKAKNKTNAIIKDIQILKDYVGYKEVNIIVITIEEQYPACVGSKLAGLHSNKHIVSKILPDWKMPKTKEFGHVQAIVSPSTVGKRQNYSFIAEGLIGHIAKSKGIQYFTPFKDLANMKELEKYMKKNNKNLEYKLPANCVFKVSTEYGEFDAFVGYNFLMRLVHTPESKMSASFGVPKNTDMYPPKGTQSIRLNEIESIIANGNQDYLKHLQKIKNKYYNVMVDMNNNLSQTYLYLTNGESIEK